jgi:hypothetical protein
VDGNPVDPEWRGNRLVFEGLRGGEQITIQAPLNTETARLSLVGIADPHSAQERYEIEFKGHTALGVRLVVPPSAKEDAWPGQGERTWYRLFRPEALRSPQAPLKPAPAYIHPEKLVHWTVT